MSSTDVSEPALGDWKYLWREMKRRTKEPFADVPFVTYAILAIIGLGCLGIWSELIKIAIAEEPPRYDGVFTALSTFYPALVGSAAFQLILSSTGRADKTLVSFGYLVSFISVASVVLIAIFYKSFPTTCFSVSIISVCFAVWLWWFTNGDDPTYKNAPIDAASGGDPSKMPKGSTSGFKE